MEARQTILTAMFAQAVAALLLTVLLASYYVYYRKGYLKQWAACWVALLVYHSTVPIALLFVGSHAATHPLRMTLGAIGGMAAWIQPAFLLFGCRELVDRRPVRNSRRTAVLLALAVTGVALSIPYVAAGPEYASMRYFFRHGVKSLALASAFALAGLIVWRNRPLSTGPGFKVMSAGLFMYATLQVLYSGIAVAWSFSDVSVWFIPYLGFGDFMLLCFVGIGMIACLLEDERAAVIHATEQIEHLAYEDSLTGLPNRTLFFDRLVVAISRASRLDQRVAVFFIDLDRFKEINDSLGHTVGDQLLKLVALRVRNSTREADSFSRFGGDEFTLLIENVQGVEHVARVAQKIIESLRVPFHVGEHELFVSASIGISIYPDDSADSETLVRDADLAMYRAKEQGRDTYQLYAPAMNVNALERLALEQTLRRALSNREMEVHYQPLVRYSPEPVVYGVEALLRWHHPEFGLMTPGTFMASAENSGLIVPIGAWVLETACMQAKQWEERLGKGIVVSVNLSARQFQQPSLVDDVRSALETSGLPPSLLVLEITESSAMQNAENATRTLRELRKIGVRLSMDDFGTGYSSLNYLKRFPIDTLKLDRSFVRDLPGNEEDCAIASAILALAKTLGLNVVAEGIEKEEQLAFLRAQGCERFQGFLFSPAIRAEELEAFVRTPIVAPPPGSESSRSVM